MSSAAARKSLGTNVHYTEKLDDGSIFVSRVPKTMPEISLADLPPPVREYKPATRKPLTDELKHAMFKLRNEDPAHWTVSKLAKKFEVPAQVVLMLAPAPKSRREAIQRQADKEWEKMGYKKRLIRLNRLRRRLMW
ncbi:mitochondrial ribosomal protein subunit L20-domain-containing protein [Kickxella alabastrina]|uniref:mitochondrial ribosomal protein subunit L20-domain-containing protein n=1 Tax=Kickxella alabastrina TaxID=61397 RepID=UPI002220F651|nr:mitochondrial ribosomal protein subunit L20-domain-containing protein [Kickxella alabastrina]KAI7830005.1 mitochondrial ribosomal protein subunit L20-domain-containing protein [Kickxella alabastrina]